MIQNYLGNIAKEILGERIFRDVKKHILGFKFQKGYFDRFEKETKLLQFIVKPGDVFFDVGANIGVFSRLVSRIIGPDGQVHSFEPVPVTYSYLLNNINLSQYNNVITNNNAVSDSNEICTLVLPDIGNVDIYQSRISTEKNINGTRFSVSSIRLDDYYENYCDRVNLIKCDVEGAELLVFKGAYKVIEKNRPKIICEIGGGCSAFGYEPDEIFEYFAKLNYIASYYNGKSLVKCNGIDKGNSNANYIFFPEEEKKYFVDNLSLNPS